MIYQRGPKEHGIYYGNRFTPRVKPANKKKRVIKQSVLLNLARKDKALPRKIGDYAS